jgi:hypothetical protein
MNPASANSGSVRGIDTGSGIAVGAVLSRLSKAIVIDACETGPL